MPVKCEESAWFVLRTAAFSMDLSRAGEVVVRMISVLLSSKNWKGEVRDSGFPKIAPRPCGTLPTNGGAHRRFQWASNPLLPSG